MERLRAHINNTAFHHTVFSLPFALMGALLAAGGHPPPGSALGVKVNVGDKVSAGQTMFVLEAMKMENEIVAPVDGTVASINVKTGDTVDTDQVMGTLN